MRYDGCPSRRFFPRAHLCPNATPASSIEALPDEASKREKPMGLREREAALNHRLKAAQNRDTEPGSSMRCECADLRCNATLELTQEERAYRLSRPGRFWVKAGHELGGVEQVVEETTRFSVVQLDATPLYVVPESSEGSR
jgi:hypothetical protein